MMPSGPHEPQDGLDDLSDRGAGVHLQRRATPQERLDSVHVPKDPSEFVRMLSLGIVRPCGQPLDNHPGGGAEQDDVVELPVELWLIRLASADE